MRIFVDADACPKAIKDIIIRAAIRIKTEAIFVANKYLPLLQNKLLRCVIVAHGIDEADKYIVNNIMPGDLVITADIPLADLVVSKNGVALNPRGGLYTIENIKSKLATRNLLNELRDKQIIFGGPPALNKVDYQNFTNQLDKLLNWNKD